MDTHDTTHGAAAGGPTRPAGTLLCTGCGVALEGSVNSSTLGEAWSAVCWPCGLVFTWCVMSVRDDFASAEEALAYVHACGRDELEGNVPAEELRRAQFDDAARAQGSPGVMAVATDEELGICPYYAQGYEAEAREYELKGVRFRAHPSLDFKEDCNLLLDREEAERLLKEHGHQLPFDIMAKGYGDDDDSVGLTPDDLDEDDQTLEERWAPFEVWLKAELGADEDNPVTVCPACGLTGREMDAFSLLAAGMNGIRRGDPDDVDKLECGKCEHRF